MHQVTGESYKELSFMTFLQGSSNRAPRSSSWHQAERHRCLKAPYYVEFNSLWLKGPFLTSHMIFLLALRSCRMLGKLLQSFSHKWWFLELWEVLETWVSPGTVPWETLQGTKGNLPHTYIKPRHTFSAKLIPSGLCPVPGISISVLEEQITQFWGKERMMRQRRE